MQALLTYAIEIVFWAFVSLLIFDFINGLFGVPFQLPDVQQPPTIVESEPKKKVENTPLPDPWLCDAEIAAIPAPPTSLALQQLLLLPSGFGSFDSTGTAKTRTASPPALSHSADIQPKRKPGRPKKTVTFSTTTPKRKPGRPKKIA